MKYIEILRENVEKHKEVNGSLSEYPITCRDLLAVIEVAEWYIRDVETLSFENSIIKLAKFLRTNYPDEVSENERNQLADSGAVELAIELLEKPKRQTKGSK
jgi:hypothetical protein